VIEDFRDVNDIPLAYRLGQPQQERMILSAVIAALEQAGPVQRLGLDHKEVTNVVNG
jgi:hypothetical protein